MRESKILASTLNMKIKLTHLTKLRARTVIKREVYKELIIPFWASCTRQMIKSMSDRIVDDTGMSKASLEPFLKEVNNYVFGATSSLEYFLKNSGINPYYQGTSAFGVLKNQSLGELLGTRAYKFKLGSAITPVLLSEYIIPIYQLYIHSELGTGPDWTFNTPSGKAGGTYDRLGKSSTGPWHILDAGQVSFNETFNSMFNTYLNPESIFMRFYR